MALRGGSGNFGIVTRFEFHLHEMPNHMYAGQVIYPYEAPGEGFRAYREVMATAPDGFTCYPCMFTIPPLSDLPEKYHGNSVFCLVYGHVGELAEGERTERPLRELGQPILDTSGTHTFLEVHRAFDAGTPPACRWYSKGHYLSGLPDEAIETILRFTREIPGALTLAYIDCAGGAIRKVPPEAAAFPHRGVNFGFHLMAGGPRPGGR
ncbi:MAG: hypothetical protein ACO3ZW_00935 [Opitutales bacterium]